MLFSFDNIYTLKRNLMREKVFETNHIYSYEYFTLFIVNTLSCNK